LILVLFLATLALARWRFAVPAWTTLVDQAACAAASAFVWRDAAFAFALPIFDSCLPARPAYALPALAALCLLGAWSLPVAASVGVAALAGFAVHLWAYQLQGARREADRDRRERFELESLKGELLSANVRVARMAERQRRFPRAIARLCRHEITAAKLS
jgi:hypothetical protein